MRASVFALNPMAILALFVCLYSMGVSADLGVGGNLRYEIHDAADAVSPPPYHLFEANPRDVVNSHPYGYPHPPPSPKSGGSATTGTNVHVTHLHTGEDDCIPLADSDPSSLTRI